MQVCVSADRLGSAALDAVGGVQGWLNRITPLGADESKWTTDVIS